MKIYLWDDVDTTLVLSNEADLRKFRDYFIGETLIDEWVKTKIEKVSKKSKIYDNCRIYSNPAISKNALEKLVHFFEKNVEVLPYQFDDLECYAINVTNVIDCIDYSKSIYDKYEGYDVIKEIHKYSFQENLVLNENIFKIPEFRKTRIFVSESFKQAVEEAKLTGFQFIEVWDSEEVPLPPLEPLVFAGPSYDFKEAYHMVQEDNKTVANDKWVMQMSKGELCLGRREPNGIYTWIFPIYLPPILLEMQWYVTDPYEITEKGELAL
ncbi:DUF1629 domain-containing protein [Paenibacillus filicis]|uniref:DUF1629 domain-containing protein n=1 Tax=Paenibacillus filicis TaxID=669464 RepID=A0ABU9DF94_9BACL